MEGGSRGRSRARARAVPPSAPQGDAGVKQPRPPSSGPQHRAPGQESSKPTGPTTAPPAVTGRSRLRAATARGQPIKAPPVGAAKDASKPITEKLKGLGLSSSSSGPSTGEQEEDTSSTTSSNGKKTGSGDRDSSTDTVSGESTEGKGPVGRGATRGRRARETEAIIWTRPTEAQKQGKDGKSLRVETNHFALKKPSNWKLYQHRVDFHPPTDSTMDRKRLVRQVRDKIGTDYIFDGHVMFAIVELGNKDNPMVLITHNESDKTEVKVTIRIVGTVEPTNHYYVMFLNIVLRTFMEKLNLQLMGRNYFDAKAKIQDPNVTKHNLELWPGYSTTIKQHERNLLLMVDITHKVLRTDTVLDQLKALSAAMRGGNDRLRSEAEKLLLGNIIITRYNNATYRIDDILWDLNPSKTFKNERAGTDVSYVQYYKERYGLTIKDMKQPLLVSMPKDRNKRAGELRPVFLVPELCNMTGLSEQQRANFSLMKDLDQYIRSGPATKLDGLKKFARRITSVPEIKENLKKWGLEFQTDPEVINARVLDIDGIMGGDNRPFKQTADWTGAFRNWKPVSTKSLIKWAIIHPKKTEGAVKDFAQKVMTAGKQQGVEIRGPKMFPMEESGMHVPFNRYTEALEKVIGFKPELIMVIIPRNKDDLYSMIKRKCIVENSIPSQVITSNLLNKPKGLDSVATKVATQLLCKMGGEPWCVKIPIKGVMVVGYDTYHDSQQKGRSVGALVASLNDTFTRYFTITDFHDHFEEMSSHVSVNICKAVKAYEEVNKKFPDKIIFYRDGVGEGQIPHVWKTEVKNIQKMLEDYSDNIKLTFIITSKRVNTKFFAGGQNPVHGLVVDDVVTLPERYDFFLVSQSVRQGCVAPTSFNILINNSGLKTDHLQKLTYKLTQLYFNYTGTVRVPAPVQYAHKLAFLVGTSLHAQPQEGMSNILYFL